MVGSLGHPSGRRQSRMLSLFLAPAGANNVLILGDSIAEFSGRSMSEYCAGQSYVNMAVRDAAPGRRTAQWELL